MWYMDEKFYNKAYKTNLQNEMACCIYTSFKGALKHLINVVGIYL